MLSVLVLAIGCTSTGSSVSTSAPEQSVAKPDSMSTQDESNDFRWLAYADPIADANLAIGKKDFKLLAFASRMISFPGIDAKQYPAEDLQQRCGVKVLSGTGDSLRIDEDLTPRKALREYARQYNTVVLRACLKSESQ